MKHVQCLESEIPLSRGSRGHGGEQRTHSVKRHMKQSSQSGSKPTKVRSPRNERHGDGEAQSETDAMLVLIRSHVRLVESQYPVSLWCAGVDHLDAHRTP